MGTLLIYVLCIHKGGRVLSRRLSLGHFPFIHSRVYARRQESLVLPFERSAYGILASPFIPQSLPNPRPLCFAAECLRQIHARRVTTRPHYQRPHTLPARILDPYLAHLVPGTVRTPSFIVGPFRDAIEESVAFISRMLEHTNLYLGPSSVRWRPCRLPSDRGSSH